MEAIEHQIFDSVAQNEVNVSMRRVNFTKVYHSKNGLEEKVIGGGVGLGFP